MDFDVVKRVLAALESHGVQYAIFGAIALNLHGIVRGTEDLEELVHGRKNNHGKQKRRTS